MFTVRLAMLFLFLSYQSYAAIVVRSTEERDAQADKEWMLEAKDNQLFYDGKIKEGGVDALIKLYTSLESKPSMLVIRSSGGSSVAGMTMGEFIHARNMDVRVVDYCGSACANFVFTAAKNKFMNKDAIIWWHGSLRSKIWDIPSTKETYRCQSDDRCGKELAQVIREKYECRSAESCSRELSAIEYYFSNEFDSLRTREDSFFKAIGVDARITTYGQEEVDCRCNWTFSVSDMEKFQIRNVVIVRRTALFTQSDVTKKTATEARRKVVVLRLPKDFVSLSP